jgi:multimeric flavodoxin WrbA
MTMKVAVIHSSATGTVHALAQAVAEGAASAGAGVRLRRVAELAPDSALAQNRCGGGTPTPPRRSPRPRLRTWRGPAHSRSQRRPGSAR